MSAEDEPLRALMVRYQDGEMPAFEELYRTTLPMVRGYLYSLSRDASSNERTVARERSGTRKLACDGSRCWM